MLSRRPGASWDSQTLGESVEKCMNITQVDIVFQLRGWNIIDPLQYGLPHRQLE
jgi:hypothetical protein